MSLNLRFPNITASTEKEQLVQIKSFLHQLVQELNYALPTISEGASAQTIEVQGGEMSYYELRSLIISTTQSLKEQYEKLYEQLGKDYVSKKEYQDLVDDLDTLEKALPENYAAKGDFTAFQETVIGDIKTIQDDLDALEDALTALGAGSADYVTEEGTAEGWTYKKWKKGTYDMFGEFTVTTTTICTDMGSMFCSEELSLPTPFAIDRAIVSGSADDLFLVASGGRASVDADTNISFVLLRPFSFDANLEIIVRLHVTGTYHQGGTE
jgi:hypothetical protein